MLVVPVLETERLVMREFRESDLDRLATAMADEEVVRYIGGKTQTRAETWRSMAMLMGHWHFRGYGWWALEEKATGLFVGRVGCWYPEGWPGREVGWTICKDRWGRGYAPEAAAAAFRFAFQTLGWDSLISVIDVDNANSMAVARKLGETRGAEIPFFGRQVALWGITRADWAARQA